MAATGKRWLMVCLVLVVPACQTASHRQDDTQPSSKRGGVTPNKSGVSRLDVGMGFSCELTAGAVYCWGAGHQGQLGQGSLESSPRPIRVVGIDDAVYLDVGFNHTCVVHQTGRVSCWGGNRHAQLGDGTTDERATPVSVLDLTDAAQVALGSDTSCALRNDGSVTCWGRLITRYAGNPASDNEHLPTPVEGLAQVKQLVLGNLHLCAVQGERNELVCTGLNHNVTPSKGFRAPLKIESTGHFGVGQVVAGDGFTCFEQQGTWRCWGAGWRGALGRPYENTVYAADAKQVPGLGQVRDMAVGGSLACAVDFAGAVDCWGDGDYRVRRLKGFEPIQELVLTSASHERHACARNAKDAAICWGLNDSGQLGDGTKDAATLPVAVLPPASTRFIPAEKEAPPVGQPFVAQAIAAGYDETCAVKDGEVWCWGQDHSIINQERSYRRHPQRVPNIQNVAQLAAGFGFMCARIASGQVHCWGDNDQMQLGDGTDKSRQTPVAVKGLNDAVDLVADYGRACALRKTGTVTCWGNHKGLEELAAARGWPTKIERLAMGEGHLCLLSAGTVFCQGSNSSGQLGNGEGGCKPDPTDLRCPSRRHPRCKQRQICLSSETFVAAKGVVDATSLALGGGFSCAAGQNGRVLCWGRNSQGQLGLGPNQPSEVHLPTQLGALTDVVQLTASSGHACALTRKGRIACWGQNVFGQLGDRTTQSRSEPSTVFGLSEAAQVSCGMSHSCARRKNGEVWCWGENDNGALGTGKTERHQRTPSPVLVEAP